MGSMGFRGLVSAAAAAIALVIGAAEARADCSPSDPFAEAEVAPRVAIVRASRAPAGPGNPAFEVQLHVEKVLKGAAAPAVSRVSFNPLSGTSLQIGRRYLVFFTPDGAIQQGCATVDVGDAPGRTVADAVTAWLGARSERDRTALLVKLGTAGPFGAGEARVPPLGLAHLAASPDLLAATSPAERASLVALVPSVVDERVYSLAWVLARLRATESMPAWNAFLGVSHPSANHRPVQDALELMTNRRDPAYTPGRDFHGPQAEALRTGWVRWQAAHGGKAAQEVVAVGARERGAAAPVLSDRASLARVVRTEKDELTRKVALAACEQLLRTPASLLPGAGAATHVDWTRAIAVCSPPPAAAP